MYIQCKLKVVMRGGGLILITYTTCILKTLCVGLGRSLIISEHVFVVKL